MAPKYVPQTGLEYGLSLLGVRTDPRQESGLEYGLRQLRQAAGKPGKPETGLQYGMQQLGRFFNAVARPASAAEPLGPNPLSGDPTGRYVPPFMQPGISGADIGGDGRSDEARALASQYAPKPFPMTQEGQFDRYFKTPEFDYVFGAQTGKGPKTAAEMTTLGTQRQAPTSAPLSDYYRSQSALGRVNQEEIQKMYADRPDLQKWAAANPMLAQREYVKRQGGRPLAPDQETVMGDLGSRAQSETGYTPEAFGMPANPVPPTQQPGPGGMDQGERVSYSRGVENIKPLQAMKTTIGDGMPAFSTTGGFQTGTGSLSDAADAFVKAMKTKSGAFGS